jgi:DNA-binding transcriptional LysR family regulator
MTAPFRAIDLDTVRAFVMVADLGSFTRAAEVLDTSQAGVSLKLKRLEDRLGYRLLERTPRRVRLSLQGETFLTPARDLLAAHERALSGAAPPPKRLVLGISDHVAGPNLPHLIAQLAAHDPGLLIEVRIAMSRQLLADFDRGDLDAVILRHEGERQDGVFLGREPLGWFGAPTMRPRAAEPVRLANLAPPCGMRQIATSALDAADIPWTEVFVGGGVAAVGAAVSAGLAVAALARRAAPAGAVDVGEILGLPPLTPLQIMLHARAADPRARDALRIIQASFRSAATV